jgi:hypothetical protein
VLRRWIDAGKFLTGFSAVGSIAIPAILAHAQVRSWMIQHRSVFNPADSLQVPEVAKLPATAFFADGFSADPAILAHAQVKQRRRVASVLCSWPAVHST